MAKILIIDDSRFARNSLARILEQDDHSVEQAGDGKQGIESIVRKSPDLVIADLLMPEMDGFEMLGALKDMESSPPVIIVTADIQDSTRSRCMESGAFKVLEKPVKPSLLREAIGEGLSSGGKGATDDVVD